MKIGIDLDNTVICYDASFHKVAMERGWIPRSTPETKAAVKTAIFRNHNNAIWTELQGIVYGERLSEAQPYPDVFEFFKKCRSNGHVTCIISHKTQYPAMGPRQDLRKSALDWLMTQGWLNERLTGLRLDSIEFTDTRKDKVAAIRRRNCEIFIDDLPEVFQEPDFPNDTKRYLFDPDDCSPNWSDGPRIRKWLNFYELILP